MASLILQQGGISILVSMLYLAPSIIRLVLVRRHMLSYHCGLNMMRSLSPRDGGKMHLFGLDSPHDRSPLILTQLGAKSGRRQSCIPARSMIPMYNMSLLASSPIHLQVCRWSRGKNVASIDDR